jgi:hypothetical protein
MPPGWTRNTILGTRLLTAGCIDCCTPPATGALGTNEPALRHLHLHQCAMAMTSPARTRCFNRRTRRSV